MGARNRNPKKRAVLTATDRQGWSFPFPPSQFQGTEATLYELAFLSKGGFYLGE